MSDKLNLERTEKLVFLFEGQFISGFKGETIGAALLRHDKLHLRDAPNSNTPRGMFCGMGICQECVVDVGGELKEACRTPIREGVSVKKVKHDGRV